MCEDEGETERLSVFLMKFLRGRLLSLSRRIKNEMESEIRIFNRTVKVLYTTPGLALT